MQKPIANVFTWPADDPQLLGGQCKDCGAVTFPMQSRCPRCGTESMAELPLPRRGTLVSWTTQEFPPSVPYRGDPKGESFEPFGIGLVQLDDLVRVESRLTECDPQKLDFGMDVVLRIVPFYVDDDGNEVMTFAFAPNDAQNSEEH
jgi:uncharacterized OB-fold protein